MLSAIYSTPTPDTLSAQQIQAALGSAELLAFAVDQWDDVRSPGTVVRVQFLREVKLSQPLAEKDKLTNKHGIIIISHLLKLFHWVSTPSLSAFVVQMSIICHNLL